ncbi:hypothetical protein OUY22_17515 [Nonomuraea sp. MCN248]|uniref:HEAT repeat domain-containing protein n=1 Tax=Nonomuraea corallina TaxID=2989783 RepID=A0ABT4SDD6_9ACTN|nr:hypothetical protein [Nonomuraea corallina]MDA0635221.1 hypothetical protein [Nonomuraea corallina]
MPAYEDVFPLQQPVRLPPREELVAAVRSAPLAAEFLDGQEDELEAWGEVCRDRLDEALLLEVVRLFVAREPAAGDPPAELVAFGLVRGANPYEATPVGLWMGRRLIEELTGQEVPIMGSLAERDAAGLLRGLRSYPEAERDEELAGWLARRDPAGAAKEMAAALPEVSPLSRAVGIELLGFNLGDEGRRALDDLVIEPKVGAVIAARLSRDDRQPATEEIGWVLVDMAAALLEFGGETSEVVESVAAGMAPDEQASTITLLALCDHPATEPVLRVFIDHHPDPGVAAAARKALRRLHGLASARG